MENLAAALVRLENSQRPEDLQSVMAALLRVLAPEGLGDLRRAFAVWLNRVLLPARLPGVEIPALNDLREVNAMLAERVKEWTKEWEVKGRAEGRAEGHAEGRAEGRKSGEAAVVLRLIERKFGGVPDAVRQRIDQASADELLDLADRILVAANPEDLLARH